MSSAPKPPFLELRKNKGGTMGMNDPVRVKLSEHDLAERATIMATKLEHVRYLRKKKSEDAKSTQALIDSDLNDLEAMARVVLEAEDEARQGDLFVDGTLGRVADELVKRCTCEGGPESAVKDAYCALHGAAGSDGRDEDGPEDDQGASDAGDSVRTPSDDEAAVGDPVDVGKVGEPASVGRFRRGRRANAGGAA
jgi:hypothetical protein